MRLQLCLRIKYVNKVNNANMHICMYTYIEPVNVFHSSDWGMYVHKYIRICLIVRSKFVKVCT